MSWAQKPTGASLGCIHIGATALRKTGNTKKYTTRPKPVYLMVDGCISVPYSFYE